MKSLADQLNSFEPYFQDFKKVIKHILYSMSNLDLLHSHDPSKGPTECPTCSTRFLHSGWLELEILPMLCVLWKLFSYSLVVSVLSMIVILCLASRIFMLCMCCSCSARLREIHADLLNFFSP